MGRTVDADVSTTATLLKREDCKLTKHDSAFSQWKILVGPCDWKDYLLNKEGAERYRTQNLPNCYSCPGLYELGVVVSLPQKEGKSSSKLGSKNIIPVYLGQADNVRTRLQQYGRDGAHLEKGWSNGEQDDRKGLGLFSGVFSHGFPIAVRWAPMKSKRDAEETESQLLKAFDYAWNRGMNGERRPGDIHRKLDAASSSKRVPLVWKKLHVFPPKEEGISIKLCDSYVLENGSNFYTKQEDIDILSRIFKFSRSRPTLVSKECDLNNNTVICGVELGHGSICTRPPVEGRKRCPDHKGMKVIATENIFHLTCGVTLDDASLCTRAPVAGRKRCEEHKGMRMGRHIPLPLVAQEKHYTPRSGLVLEKGTFWNRQKSCEEHKGMMGDGYNYKPKVLDGGANSLTCGATALGGSSCRRKAGEGSKYCWQHESITHSGAITLSGANSLTCGATTLGGSSCRRKVGERSKYCWQHEAITHSGAITLSGAYSSTCGAITRSGSYCRRNAGGGSKYCWQHQ